MKSRLTITLSEDVLKKVDLLIDKKTIRNRSHAIEHLIERSLQPNISTAIILAGGPNKKPYSPMTVIGTKPLILNTINLLKKHGVKTVHIAINDQGKELKKLLGDGKEYGLHIIFHHESKPLGTAGAIRAIATSASFVKSFTHEHFFVIAGDVLTNINLDELAAFHEESKALVTMAVKPRPAQKNYDNVFVQGHTVVNFKASEQHEIVGIVNAGVYIFNSEVISMIPNKEMAMLETDVFPALSNSGRLTAFSFQGVWFDISSDLNYKQAVERL